MELLTAPAAWRFFRNHRRLLISGFLLGLFIAELVWLHHLAHYDLAVYDWMQAHRSCGLDRIASFLHFWTTKPYATAALLMTVAAWLLHRGRWQDFWRLALIVIGAALLCEWFKLLVSRPRPSALAFIDYGTSFPSGHVTSAVTIFGGVYYFLGKCRLHGWWQHALGIGAVSALVLVVGFQRVYFTHHWVSDALAGVLLGGAWLFFALDHFSVCVNRRSTLFIAALFAFAFIALRVMPGLRVNGPTPMAWRGEFVGFVDLAAYAPDKIHRRESTLAAGRAPDATWHFSQQTTTVDLPLLAPGDYYLLFAARPSKPRKSAGCRSIDLLLNGQTIRNLVIFNGWRDYRIRLDRDKLNPGTNRLTVNLGPGEYNAMLFTTPAVHARRQVP